MLVLSRKVMETILIPHLGISLKVLRVGGGKVSLGIEAPPDVSMNTFEKSRFVSMRTDEMCARWIECSSLPTH